MLQLHQQFIQDNTNLDNYNIQVNLLNLPKTSFEFEVLGYALNIFKKVNKLTEVWFSLCYIPYSKTYSVSATYLNYSTGKREPGSLAFSLDGKPIYHVETQYYAIPKKDHPLIKEAINLYTIIFPQLPLHQEIYKF